MKIVGGAKLLDGLPPVLGLNHVGHFGLAFPGRVLIKKTQGPLNKRTLLG